MSWKESPTLVSLAIAVTLTAVSVCLILLLDWVVPPVADFFRGSPYRAVAGSVLLLFSFLRWMSQGD